MISEVGRTTSGVVGATGKEWTCRELSLLIPYVTDSGETKYDNIVADYFGDATDGDLHAMIELRTRLSFFVNFSTRLYNGRRYMSARVWGLAKLV